MFSEFVSVLALLSGSASGLTREYVSVMMKKNWTDAQTYCKQNYKDLATITNDEENQRLYALMGNQISAWIGMYRAQMMVNDWQWSDRTPSSFAQWTNNQPSNNQGFQNCVEMEPFGWNDQFCYEQRPFVCNRFLILVKEKKTWDEALEYCRKNYTGLASPASESQVKLAEIECNQTQTDRIWTGLRFINENWLWVSKDPVGVQVQLPSCPAPRHRCGALNTKKRLWENGDCEEKLNFLCYH